MISHSIYAQREQFFPIRRALHLINSPSAGVVSEPARQIPPAREAGSQHALAQPAGGPAPRPSPALPALLARLSPLATALRRQSPLRAERRCLAAVRYRARLLPPRPASPHALQPRPRPLRGPLSGGRLLPGRLLDKRQPLRCAPLCPQPQLKPRTLARPAGI